MRSMQHEMLVCCDESALAGEKCCGEREQWFFFTPRQERELRGGIQ